VTARASYALNAPPQPDIPLASSFARSIATGDFNGDGKLDVAVAGDGLYVMLGGGKGVHYYPLNQISPTYIVAGDFNGDGHTDLAVGSLQAVFLFTGVGDGNFLPGTTIGLSNYVNSLAVADFNGDGIADLAISSQNDLQVFLFNRDGSYQAIREGNSGAQPFIAADFNGDGIADLVSLGGVLIGNGDGTFGAAIPLGYNLNLGSYMVAGDLNGDGNTDLVIPGADPNVVFVLLGDGKGRFPSGFKYSWNSAEPAQASDISAVALSDFNGDGKLDLVIGAGVDVQVFFGVGDGTFRDGSPIRYRVGYAVRAVATGDWNGDGADDVFYSYDGLQVLTGFSSPRAGLSIAVDHRATAPGSGVVTYTITVSNSSTAAPTSGAVLVGETPIGMFSMAGDGWSCNSGIFCTRSDTLLPGGSYPPITATLTTIPYWIEVPPQFPNLVTVMGGSSLPAEAIDTFPLPPLTPYILTYAGSGASLTPTLSWNGPGADLFDIYFGTSSPPPLVASNFAGNTYSAGSLFPCTAYYWKVVGKRGGISVSSDISSFLTRPSVTLSQDVAVFPSSGGFGAVQVNSSSNCAWTTSFNPSGTVTVTSGDSAVGSATIRYSVPPYSGQGSRAIYMYVADKVHAILQDGSGTPARCVTRLSGPAFVDSAAQSINFNVTTDPACDWSINSDPADWVTFPGHLSVPTVSITANTSGASRSSAFIALPFFGSALNFAGYWTPFTVTQRATNATFADVALSHPFFDAINLLRARSITDGCASAPLRFCPDDNITRGQMAVFIVRAIMGGDNFTYSSTPYFNDTASGHPFFKWIQKMWELGITNGCAPGAYCPGDPVTRGQMAVFIIRARLGASATFSYPTAPLFSDTIGNPFFSWIQKMGQLGITNGCAAGQYCPNDPVTRGQMAVFIMRGAFNQLLSAPRPIVTSVSPGFAPRGQTVNVTVTGQNTYFNGGTPQVLAGPGITVSNVSVTSATSLTAQFQVAPDAAPGPRSITVIIPGEIEATLPNGFKVQ
jgi:hypothetical protein